MASSIVDVEPDVVNIQPEFTANGVTVEVVASTGDGFRTVLDLDAALDVAMRIIGAIARLRGYGAP